MTDNDLDKLKLHFEKMRLEINTPEKALAYLVKLGTHNPDGSLTELYGGEYTTHSAG